MPNGNVMAATMIASWMEPMRAGQIPAFSGRRDEHAGQEVHAQPRDARHEDVQEQRDQGEDEDRDRRQARPVEQRAGELAAHALRLEAGRRRRGLGGAVGAGHQYVIR